MLVTLAIGVPLRTMSPWLASKYGALKSTIFARSGVIVISLMSRSNGGCNPTVTARVNGKFSHFTVPMLRRLAISLMRSTSKPVGLDSGGISNGGAGNSAPTSNVPAVFTGGFEQGLADVAG